MRLRLLFATCLLCASVAGAHAQQGSERQALIDSLNTYSGMAMIGIYLQTWHNYAAYHNISTDGPDGKTLKLLKMHGEYALSKTVLPLPMVRETVMKEMGIDTTATTDSLRRSLQRLRLSERYQSRMFKISLSDNIDKCVPLLVRAMLQKDINAEARAYRLFLNALAEIKPNEETLQLVKKGFKDIIDKRVDGVKNSIVINTRTEDGSKNAKTERYLKNLTKSVTYAYARTLQDYFTHDEIRLLAASYKDYDASKMASKVLDLSQEALLSGELDKSLNNSDTIIGIANKAEVRDVYDFVKQVYPSATLTTSNIAQNVKFVKKDLALSEAAQRGENDFPTVEQMPEFPGGDVALMQYLNKNVKYPHIAEMNGVQGRVIVSFVVEIDGSITNVHVLYGADPSLDKEAIRVVKTMPKWKPGKNKDKPVRVKYFLPVTFRLT